MHFHSVINILGLLLMFMAVTMLAPLPFSYYYGSGDHTALLYSALITFLVGLSAWYFTEFNEDLRPKEGFAIVTFSWVGLSLFGSLPFLLSLPSGLVVWELLSCLLPFYLFWVLAACSFLKPRFRVLQQIS